MTNPKFAFDVNRLSPSSLVACISSFETFVTQHITCDTQFLRARRRVYDDRVDTFHLDHHVAVIPFMLQLHKGPLLLTLDTVSQKHKKRQHLASTEKTSSERQIPTAHAIKNISSILSSSHIIIHLSKRPF